MDDLESKVVIVTGAGKGIGRAAAVELARLGAITVIASRNKEALDETLCLVENVGGRGVAVPTDVRQEADVRNLVDSTVGRYGRLDGAFNNAGIFGSFSRLHEDSEENYDTVVDTNLKAVWLCMKHQIPVMLEGGGGSIVNCSSVAGLLGHAKSCVYSASKHAVIGLSKSAAIQYGADNIRVNVVCPGSTDTEMLRAVYNSSEELSARADTLPIGRLGRPKEVAQLAVWLCSDASAFVTGQAIAADGGVTAGGRSVRAKPLSAPPLVVNTTGTEMPAEVG